MKKGKPPKDDLMWPSNFEGDKLHLNLLKKTQLFGSSSFVIHMTYSGKVANFLENWHYQNDHETKKLKFYVVAP